MTEIRFEGIDGVILYLVKNPNGFSWVDDPRQPHLIYKSGRNHAAGRFQWPVVEHPYMGAVPMEGTLYRGGWRAS